MVHTRLIDIQTVYDDAGVHALGQRWRLEVEATFSPDTTSFDHDPRETVPRRLNVWGDPVGGGVLWGGDGRGRLR